MKSFFFVWTGMVLSALIGMGLMSAALMVRPIMSCVMKCRDVAAMAQSCFHQLWWWTLTIHMTCAALVLEM